MKENITAIILAGGRGTRVGGADKGLIPYQGKTLVEHVMARIAPQVDAIVISANRNLESYAGFGYTPVCDLNDEFQGPLAGIVAAGERTGASLLLIVPCDTPQLPNDLCSRLTKALHDQQAEIAIAHDGERTQQLCMLMQAGLLNDIKGYLQKGERRVISWVESRRWTAVDFSDQADAFRNLNKLT